MVTVALNSVYTTHISSDTLTTNVIKDIKMNNEGRIVLPEISDNKLLIPDPYKLDKAKENKDKEVKNQKVRMIIDEKDKERKKKEYKRKEIEKQKAIEEKKRTEAKRTKDIKLIYQNDEPQSSHAYGTGTIGIDGCGIASITMVLNYYDNKVTPMDVADQYGSYNTLGGTAWSIFYQVSKDYNLSYRNLGNNIDSVIDQLKKNHPVIVSVGPGDFTVSGHLMVIREYKNGKLYINDPYNRGNYNKGWDPSRIQSQSMNFWALYK